MREERSTLTGNQIYSEPVDFWGTIVGDLAVVDGGKVYIRGAVYGNLMVYIGGRVHIYGNVSGNLYVEQGAKVIHSGVVGGDAINNGGRLYVERNCQVMGKVRTKAGETKVDARANVREA